MKRKKLISVILYIVGIICLGLGISSFIVLSSNENKLEADNINLENKVDSAVLSASYEKIDKSELKPVFFDTMQEAVENAKYYETSFKGKLTHYGPDCPLCGGHLGCNGQDARNGNIYYNDKEYGTVRVVASSKILPCGSIIRINVDEYDPNGMYAIVLDRGVSPGNIDLLKTSQRAWSPVRTLNNVVFDIVRYGY